jgi:hypothetical protein
VGRLSFTLTNFLLCNIFSPLQNLNQNNNFFASVRKDDHDLSLGRAIVHFPIGLDGIFQRAGSPDVRRREQALFKSGPKTLQKIT